MVRTLKAKSQHGVSMIETLLVFPVMFLIGLGIVHLGLIYQAQSNLEYAALMAARVGSVTSVDVSRMREEVSRRMSPSQIGATPFSPDDVLIEIINPTKVMFDRCGQEPLDTTACSGQCEIPNFGLQYRDPDDIDCDGGASIQDANLLRIKVTIRFDSKIPFMNMRLFPGDSRNMTSPGVDTSNVSGDGVDISAVATVRMQTPARMTLENEGYYR